MLFPTMKVSFNYLCAFLSLLAISCGILRSQSEHPLTMHIKYDQPINGYNVDGVFYPFDARCETGQVTLRFKSLTDGGIIVYSNLGQTTDGHPAHPAKFTGYSICEFLFADKNACFRDGDTLMLHYNIEPGVFTDSPLYYYAEFQFFDVDFDGKEEFLINDYYRGRCGNNYTVYEITSEGFVLKDEFPFNCITNETTFIPESRQIRVRVCEDVFETVDI